MTESAASRGEAVVARHDTKQRIPRIRSRCQRGQFCRGQLCAACQPCYHDSPKGHLGRLMAEAPRSCDQSCPFSSVERPARAQHVVARTRRRRLCRERVRHEVRGCPGPCLAKMFCCRINMQGDYPRNILVTILRAQPISRQGKGTTRMPDDSPCIVRGQRKKSSAGDAQATHRWNAASSPRSRLGAGSPNSRHRSPYLSGGNISSIFGPSIDYEYSLWRSYNILQE